ncbi:gustatory receptor 68a-like [Leguminivora glycinivorella]|uniref:gustatory receptor 68a-like n=1 Tax=Leguminivora glycinivorella TaxID=1035111 RepID=UPI00200E7698|nr:gustatory receptor 68a-like [Leguminivora glycinivorella]
MFTLKKYFSPLVNKDEELSFLQIFKPLYIVLAALGLFPQTVRFPDGIQNTTLNIKNSMVNSMCTLFMIITVHAFMVFHLQELNVSSKDNSMTEDKMTLMSYIIDLVIEILFCTVAYFCAIRDRNLYVTILNDMAVCWDRLAMGKRRRILGQLRVQINCVVLATLLAMMLVLAVATYTGYSGVWKMILVTLTFVLPDVIQFTMIAFYFVMILMVVTLLRNIEEEFKLISVVKGTVANDFVEAHLVVSISEIREIYVKTLEIKRQINEAFQAPLLVAMVVCFHELVSMPHMIYHGLSFQANFTTHDAVECSVWVINQLLKMYALAKSGALLKTQVNEIGRTIHNIPISGDRDLKIYLDVLHFSSLMTYQDTAITIYGYFPLDSTLVFNIVASAAMYLVILVQFDKPE